MTIRRNAIFLILISLLFVTSNQAQARTCYTMPEAEAEQGIRIHSELMVISLNCQHLYPQTPMTLYQKYRLFTSRNANLFAEYERELYNYFQQRGDKPEVALNALRTKFANRISNDAAKMRPDMFCSYYGERIDKAANMNNMELRRWAGTFFEKYPVQQPFCTARR